MQLPLVHAILFVRQHRVGPGWKSMRAAKQCKAHLMMAVSQCQKARPYNIPRHVFIFEPASTPLQLSKQVTPCSISHCTPTLFQLMLATAL